MTHHLIILSNQFIKFMNSLFDNLFAKKANKIMGFGLTYINRTNPALPAAPLVFSKTSNTLIQNPSILKLDNPNYPILHEVEVGILISKLAYKISEAEVKDIIGGYFLLLDLTSKKLLERKIKLKKFGK